MKKTLYITFVFLMAMFFSGLAHASSFEDTLKSAQKANKPILLYFFSKSCGYCTLMDKKTLADKEVDGILKKDFVLLRVDSDKFRDLSEFYQVRGTPSSWFLNSAGKPIFEAPGYIEQSLYKKVLEYVKGNYYKQMDIQTFLKKTPDLG
jgi:thioredoxin-related protein